MELLNEMGRYGHEQVAMHCDPDAGLKAIIAVHDTTLGPSCGGTRIWPYATEDEALNDALRLSRAMTYKSAVAGLPLGGGKAVIIADSRKGKTEAMLRSFGRFVDTLGGRYLTTTDVGSTGLDLEYIRQETRHVVGLSTSAGGSGDTSIMTGLGVYMGMKACAKSVWGCDSLAGRRVAMQGFGKVASNTARHLLKENATVTACDVYPGAVESAKSMGVEVTTPEDIYDVDCDIFSPNALGGVINGGTIPRLRCQIVAGGANNQLLTDADGGELQRRGILYAPDYVINAGGIINVEAELGGKYSPERAREKTERIYDIMAQVIEVSNREEITTGQAADRIAEERIASVRKIRGIYRGC